MKVLFLNAMDTVGGAARAAFRLHKGLLAIGVNTQMLVQNKDAGEPSVIGPKPFLGNWFDVLRPHLDALPVILYPKRNRMLFSPAFLPERVNKRIAAINPEIIHLHWICEGFVRLENLRRFRKPMVWTLHDSWAFTGGCHVPFDCTRFQERCGACPTLGSTMERDLSSWVWQRKQKAWRDLDLTIIAPSRWMAERARSSTLLQNMRVEVIPNGIDLHRFRPFEKTVARELLSLPQEKKLILFGGVNSITDRNKGYQLLVPALLELAAMGWNENAELVVFGSSRPNHAQDLAFNTHYLGRLSDELTLALLYSAVDVFVTPSIQENLPNTVMEAMACGTPCVAFNIGGIPDMIEQRQNGYLAEPYDPADLAEGINWVLGDEMRYLSLSRAAREKVEAEFSLDTVSKKYMNVYSELLA